MTFQDFVAAVRPVGAFWGIDEVPPESVQRIVSPGF